MGAFERWFWRAMLAVAWVAWVWLAHRPLTPRPTVHVPGGAQQPPLKQ